MPLSKAKNRERMRQSRLHKWHCAPQDIKPVQPKPLTTPDNSPDIAYIDADDNPVYEEGRDE